MALRIIFIVTIAITTQVLIIQPGVAQSTLKPGTFSAEFLEAYNDLDDFASLITLNVLDIYLRGNNSKVEECYNAQEEKYKTAVESFKGETKKLAEKISMELGQNYKTHGEAAKNALEETIKLLTSYQSEITDLIKRKNYEGAADKSDDVMLKLQEQIAKYNAEMLKIRNLRKTLSDANKKAETGNRLFTDIRDNSKQQCQEIAKDFKRCVNKGKNFLSQFYDTAKSFFSSQ